VTVSASAAPADALEFDDRAALVVQAKRRVADNPGILAIAGTIASQTALITGLLYYFGWAREQSTLTYFGLDTSLVDYSTADYVLRSVNVAFTPIVRVALAALVLLGLHRFIVLRALQMPAGSPMRRVGRWIVTVVRMIATAITALVTIKVAFPGWFSWPSGLTLPLMVMASVALLGYVIHVRSTHPEEFVTTPQPYPRVQALVLLALGLLGALWAVSLYAQQVGTSRATDIVAGLPQQPAVIVYSAERIAIFGTGVEVAEIAQPGSRYRYQYSGVRLLTRSADKYLLLPVGWQRGRDAVFMLRDDDSIRVDIAAQ
jgi:hypothetical protein